MMLPGVEAPLNFEAIDSPLHAPSRIRKPRHVPAARCVCVCVCAAEHEIVLGPASNASLDWLHG